MEHGGGQEDWSRAMEKNIFLFFFEEQEVTVAQAFSRKIFMNKLKFLNEEREI